MRKSSKRKIISAIGGLVVCSTMIVFALSSYAWFSENKDVGASGIEIMVDTRYEEELIFNFDLFKHDITDYDDLESGYLVEKDIESGNYNLKMNSYDSIFDNLAQCGVVVKAYITRIGMKPFTGDETFDVEFARDREKDGNGTIFSSYSSSLIEIHSMSTKPNDLADDCENADEIYRKATRMFLNDNSHEVKQFADIATHKKEDIKFIIEPDASRKDKTMFVRYFYITYNMELVSLYQSEHYTEIDPVAETIEVSSDISQFRLLVEGDL